MAGVGSFVLFCSVNRGFFAPPQPGVDGQVITGLLGPLERPRLPPFLWLVTACHKSSNTPIPGAFPFSIQGRVTSRPRSKRIQSVGLSLLERLKLQGPGKGKRVYREVTYVGPLQSTGLWPQPSPTFQSYSSSRLGQVRRRWEQDEAARGRGST